MLIDIGSDVPIDRIPHPEMWRAVSERLSEEQLQGIFEEIEDRITGMEVSVAGWIPGSDWTNTPFQPIFETAARFDRETAAKMFGLIVWVYFMQRADRWGFGRYDTQNQHVESMTYF